MTRWQRRGCLVAAVLIGSAIAFGTTANLYMLRQGGRIYDDLATIPYHRVGLLLGSATRRPDGGDNVQMLNRITAAVHLLRAGRIDHILVSGDNHRADYNEPRDIRAILIAAGVPASRITLDDAGFHTMDSIVRAHLIFGQQDLTIISQRYHDFRALALARHLGMDAVAFAAPDVSGSHAMRPHLREMASRTAAFLYCTCLPCRSHVLGRTEPIALDHPETP